VANGQSDEINDCMSEQFRALFFQANHLAWLKGCFSRPTRTYCATPITILIWNNLCVLVYQRPTRSHQSQTAVPEYIGGGAIRSLLRLPNSHALLGSGRP